VTPPLPLLFLLLSVGTQNMSYEALLQLPEINKLIMDGLRAQAKASHVCRERSHGSLASFFPNSSLPIGKYTATPPSSVLSDDSMGAMRVGKDGRGEGGSGNEVDLPSLLVEAPPLYQTRLGVQSAMGLFDDERSNGASSLRCSREL